MLTLRIIVTPLYTTVEILMSADSYFPYMTTMKFDAPAEF